MPESDGSELTWRLTYGPDESYEFSRSHWMLSEARDVKKWVGLNPPQMWVAIGQDDPEALTALLCVLRRRAGQDVRFSEVDADYGAMTLEIVGGMETDDESDPPAESTLPTRSGSRTRKAS